MEHVVSYSEGVSVVQFNSREGLDELHNSFCVSNSKENDADNPVRENDFVNDAVYHVLP